MKSSYSKVSKTVLSGAIALSLLSFQAAAEPEKAGRHLPNIPFEKLPDVVADFSLEEKFIPLDELPVMEFDEDEEMEPMRRSHDLSAVAVTPEGEVSTAEVYPEDLELLANALQQLPGNFTPEQLKSFAEHGEMNSESFKGVEVSFLEHPGKKPGPPSDKGPRNDNEFDGEMETVATVNRAKNRSR